jgi:hydroxymethylbilane synthase
VHSFKDVPGQIPDDLKIAAVLERKMANDVLLSFVGGSIASLPKNAKIGTSSVRRKAILLNHRPDLEILNCRGNVTLRIEKLMQKQYDGIVLAASGLERLNIFDASYCNIIPQDQMLSAVAQGIIAVEVRSDDVLMLEVCKAMNHQTTWNLVKAERGFLETMNADCQTPIAAFATPKEDKVHAQFLLASRDGNLLHTYEETFDIENGYEVGVKAAKIILEKSGGVV